MTMTLASAQSLLETFNQTLALSYCRQWYTMQPMPPPRRLKTTRAPCTVIAILCFMSRRHQTSCMAFQMQTMTIRHSALTQIASTNNNNNGNDSPPSLADDDDDLDAGRELAGQFYDQLKKRQAESSTTSSSSSDTPKETYDIKSNNTPPPQPIRKFTGASTSSPSRSLFTSNRSNTNNNNSDAMSPNIQREREREFNLAGRFERTFGLQVALLIFCIVFNLAIGLSGGITDGSDRSFYGDDDLIEDAVVERLERIRTDDAAEVVGKVWL